MVSNSKSETTDGSTCPRCDGKGSNPAFVHTESGSYYDPELKCDLCKGTGKVSDQTLQWLSAGKRHRDDRVARDESIMECSRRLGIRAAELSAMENGRADPARLQQ